MSKCGCYGRAKWRRGTVDPSKLVQGIKKQLQDALELKIEYFCQNSGKKKRKLCSPKSKGNTITVLNLFTNMPKSVNH